MTQRDLKKVYAISLAQWGTIYYESIEVFQNKRDFYPEGCFVYEDEGLVQGYVISHYWNSKIVPELNKPLPKVEWDCYYIHDIVLMPEYRGYLIAALIIEKLMQHKDKMCLVAVAPTQHYWKKYYGFEKTEVKSSYGVHMNK